MKRLRDCLSLLNRLEKRGVLTSAEQRKLNAIRTLDFRASRRLIESAREIHETDDVEVDDFASASPTNDGGDWVSAWVWVGHPFCDGCNNRFPKLNKRGLCKVCEKEQREIDREFLS